MLTTHARGRTSSRPRGSYSSPPNIPNTPISTLAQQLACQFQIHTGEGELPLGREEVLPISHALLPTPPQANSKRKWDRELSYPSTTMKTKWERENFLSTERKFSQAPYKSNVHFTLSPMRTTWERENFLSAERKFPKAPHTYSIQSHPLTNGKTTWERENFLSTERKFSQASNKSNILISSTSMGKPYGKGKLPISQSHNVSSAFSP
jgi:hypothetical protein